MSNRRIDRLSHLKAEGGVVLTGFPSKEEGTEGNVQIRYIPGQGLMLFAFHASNWYISRMELQKISTNKKSLTVDKLKVDKELDLHKSHIKNLDPKKVQGAETWNKAYENLRSGQYTPRFGGLKITGTDSDGMPENIFLTYDDGVLKVRDEFDKVDAVIKAKRFRFDSGSSGTAEAVLGEMLYNTSTASITASASAFMTSAAVNGTEGTPAVFIAQSEGSDSVLMLMDGATKKWTLGYDHTDVVFTDNTCDTTDESTTVAFDHGDNMDTHGVRGAPISGTGIPSDTFIVSIDASANTLVLTKAATVTGTQTLTSQKANGGLCFDTSSSFGNAIKMKLDSSTDDANAVLSLFYNSTNYTTLTTAANGATTIATVDSDGTAGDITLDADGSIILDSADGGFELHGAGATAKFADLYAGAILGYTKLQNDSTTTGHATITINSSALTVMETAQGTDLSINFVVPPSGNVEIECSFWMTGVSKGAKFALSSTDVATGFTELNETCTYDADQVVYIDESDHSISTIKFTKTGLAAGTNTTYYLAGLASGSSTYISHGRNRATGSHYPPIILKATALPATIVTGE